MNEWAQMYLHICFLAGFLSKTEIIYTISIDWNGNEWHPQRSDAAIESYASEYLWMGRFIWRIY